jgi:hypothetical protein
MHAFHPVDSAPGKRGGTLMLVLLFTAALSLVVAGLLAVLVGDKRINAGVSLVDEARNAAEGTAEVAAAEFDRRAISYGSLPANPLEGFAIPSEVRSALAMGNVDASSLAYKAGDLSPRLDSPTVIDASDPFNRWDAVKGKPVDLRHAFIYGKATAVDPVSGHPVTAYVSTLVQVRTQSWLNFGVFGNLDLEFHAGPAMNVQGPVHCNENIYVVGGSTLSFYAPVTSVKRIFRKFKDNGSTSSHTAAVKFAPKADPTSGELLAMSTSQDSRMSGFKEFADSRWHGFVQDMTFDVKQFQPPGMLAYVEDDYTTTSVNETRNFAYAYVEPQLATGTTDDAANYVFAGHKGDEVENLKVSAVAGMIIRIKARPSGVSETDWWTKIGKPDNDDPDFEPGFELLTYALGDPTRPANRSNLPQRGGDGRPIETVIPIDAAHMSATLRNKLFAAVRLVQYREDTSSGTDGNRDLLFTEFKVEAGSDAADAGAATPALVAGNRKKWYGICDRRQGYVYPNGASTTTNNGFRGAHHVLHIDLGAFNTFLNAPASEWDSVATPGTRLYNAGIKWSGALYVQLPLAPITDAAVSARKTTDKIRPAVAPTVSAVGYAVVLRNATRLPGYGSERDDDGFVFGCNGSVYVLGHYNADGNMSTGSSTDPDPGTDEVPSIIVADAVTILSQNYAAIDSSAESIYFRESAKPKKSAASTEFSSAVFAGVVPTRLTTSGTGTNGQRMGGVHNFIRFLEDWGGDTFRYRGSIGLLYESEIAIRPYYENHHSYWYAPPTRDVGYHFFFASGRYPRAWPPFMRWVRRIKVDRITGSEYDAGPPTPP